MGRGNYRDGQLQSLQGFISDITGERHAQKNQKVLAQLGHNLAAADTMEKLGEAILTAVSELWTWDALALYVRQSGQERFRTIVEVDTFNEEKQFFWSRREDAVLSIGKSIREPLLIKSDR